jgi:WD40 repeat protein
MSKFNIVRQSSYRHLFGTPNKSKDTYLQVPIQFNGDGDHIAGNGQFMAFAGRGGGGPINVLKNDQVGRFNINNPKVSVHRNKVLDLKWSPFVDTLLASTGEDAVVNVTNLPEAGLTENITKADVEMKGHTKKVTQLEWNPTSSNVLASAGADKSVRVWDVTTGECASQYAEFGDVVHHINWNRNGSQLAAIGKDKTCRIFDPRDAKSCVQIGGQEGGKKCSVQWCSAVGLVATIGFTARSKRQIHLWDLAKTDKAVGIIDIDSNNGIFNTYYDHDTSVLFLAGKGDSSIAYYEIVKEAPFCHFLSKFGDNNSQKGFAWLPKSTLDVEKCEVAKCLRVLNDSIVPVSFQVPRKSDLFQEDLFPATRAPIAAQDSAAWLEGKNAEPVLMSMNPADNTDRPVAKAAFVAKKTYAQLEAELAAANKRIAELEAAAAN